MLKMGIIWEEAGVAALKRSEKRWSMAHLHAMLLSLALVLGLEMFSRTNFESLALALALKVKSLALALALRVKSLALALA